MGATGKRIRKKFDTKAEALRFEALIQQKANDGKEWLPNASDDRTLKELINPWHDSHGQTLRDITRRKSKLDLLAQWINNPLARLLTPE